ncbi:hypothetical protein EYF80_008577 [Liparis tanakae]|uniref:Uncharacterized protein n=1 Tax=Liparis tanakae TaxID=230148 RepID=A0A4Z2IVJ5_9TELE|nr:hypothetical protein EYF80_008577 [Liparis tanakae]
MCSARCTTQLRSCGCGCGVGRSGALGRSVTLPNEGAAPPFGKPKPAGEAMARIRKERDWDVPVREFQSSASSIRRFLLASLSADA